MSIVSVKPMPESYRSISKKYRPGHPPIFTDCGPAGPTPEEIEMARELFKILDDESKDWYGRRDIFRGL